MIESIGRRLRVAFGTNEPHPAPPAADLPPVVEFVAYAEDCVLWGHVPLVADRLTDMLNDHDEFQLLDVFVEPLDGASATSVADIIVRRDELLVVRAAGPRGGRERRRRTLAHDVIAASGPYQVRGSLHSLPGADPLDSLRHRPSMVPLSHAWIDYVSNGIRRERRVEAAVVNREQVDWIRSVTPPEPAARRVSTTSVAAPASDEAASA